MAVARRAASGSPQRTSERTSGTSPTSSSAAAASASAHPRLKSDSDASSVAAPPHYLTVPSASAQPSYNPNQPAPDAGGFHTYFAQTRLYYDIAWWSLTLLVLVPASSSRALQVLCPNPPDPPQIPRPCLTPACQPGSCPAPASCAPPSVTLPDWRAVLPCSLRPYLPASPFTSPTSAASRVFPCGSPLPSQISWSAQHLPLVLSQIFLANLSFALPLITAFSLLILLIACLRPRWYVRRARTPLMMMAIMAPRAMSAIELLLVPSPQRAVTRAWVIALCIGSRAPGVMVLQAIILPLPCALQLVTSLAQVLLILCNEAWLLGPAATAAHLWAFTARNLLLALVLNGVAAIQAHSVRAQFLRRHRPATAANATAAAAAVTTATADAAAAAADAAGGQQSLGGCGAAALPQPGAPERQGCSVPRQRLRAQYVSRLAFCRVAVKVNHHAAYDHRERIRSDVEACLLVSLSATAGRQPAPLSNSDTTTTMDAAHTAGITTGPSAGTSTTGPSAGMTTTSPSGDAPQGAAVPIRSPKSRQADDATALSTIALRGCLQLLISVYSWQQGATAAFEGQQQAAGAAQLDGRALEQVVRGGLAPISREFGCQVTVSSVAPGGAEVVMCCWKGGEQLVLRRPLVSGGLPAGGVSGGGEQAVVRAKLGAAAAGGCVQVCRLQLPPHLDTAPLEVYLVASCPGREGVLLGSATTMALPPPAARELLAALPRAPPALHLQHASAVPGHTPPPPDSVPGGAGGVPGGAGGVVADLGSLTGLLEDVAAAWKLLVAPSLGLEAPGTARGDAALRGCVEGMRVYCSEEGLGQLALFLQQVVLLPQDGGPAVATTATTTTAAAAVRTPAAAVAAQAAAAVLGRPAAQASGGCSSTLHPSQPAPGGSPAAASGGQQQPAAHEQQPRAGDGICLPGPAQVTAGAGVTELAAARVAPGSSGCVGGDGHMGADSDDNIGGHGRVGADAAMEERYTAWKLQQGRGADALGAVSVVAVWVLFLLTEPRQAAAGSVRQVLPYALLDVLVFSGPWLALAAGPVGLRRRRALVIVLQAALVAAQKLAVALCWVELPLRSQGRDPTAAVLAVMGLLVPAIQRVGWKQQLLCSFLGEELPCYIMLHFACTPAAGSTTSKFIAPSLWQLFLLPVIAAMVACLMERSSRAAFSRMVAQEAALLAAPARIKRKAE